MYSGKTSPLSTKNSDDGDIIIIAIICINYCIIQFLFIQNTVNFVCHGLDYLLITKESSSCLNTAKL